MYEHTYIDKVLFEPKADQVKSLDEAITAVKRAVIADLKWKCGNTEHMHRLLYIAEFSDDHKQLYENIASEKTATRHYTYDVNNKLANYVWLFEHCHEINGMAMVCD